MRIFVHDYCGHPFQIQLSRWLAQRGHQVEHCYSTDIESPRGNVGADEPRLCIRALSLGRPVPKYSLLKRVRHERAYAALVARTAGAFAPDIIISGNAPPAIQAQLQKAARRSGAKFIYWLQDIFSAMLERVLPTKLPLIGRWASGAFRRYEFALIGRSDAVVVISEDFKPRCIANGVPAGKISVIHNWAPFDEITPLPRDNAWARQHGLEGKFVFLFSGTLGLKHNPDLLSALAQSLRHRDDARVVVVSQGLGRQFLEREKQEKNLTNLLLFDFQPFERLSSVFASADVLIAILERFAGELSVPSKILSYMCTQRPLLAALPPQNLASRIITKAGAGVVVAPDDADGFVRAAHALMADKAQRGELAAAGYAYAKEKFDIARIGGRFVRMFEEMESGVVVSPDGVEPSAL